MTETNNIKFPSGSIIYTGPPVEPQARRTMSYADLSALVGDAIANHNTREWTVSWIKRFQAWCLENNVNSFDRRSVLAFRRHLEEGKSGSGSINQALTALRRLAREALDNDVMTPAQVQSVCSVAGVRHHGVRSGNWLTKEQAEAVCDAPDPTTTVGIRDRAVLALLVGVGLRREEIMTLSMSNVAERGGRLCIVDMVGKGNRVRTVVLLPWVARRVMDWVKHARTFKGQLFRRIYPKTHRIGDSIAKSAFRDIVRKYAKQCEIENIAPHDLRRTFGKLTKAGGANDRQIMANMGHSNVAVTERYLGTALHLDDPACDHLGLELK